VTEEERGTEPASVPVPLVDLAPWAAGDRASVAAAVDAALRTSGFMLVTGHGVADDDRAAVRDVARRFFALPTAVKADHAVAVGGRGWLPPGVEANAAAEGVTSPPDMKETFAVGADTPSGDPDVGTSCCGSAPPGSGWTRTSSPGTPATPATR
jgi:isopenicillin N synthase-like dioxygenase